MSGHSTTLYNEVASHYETRRNSYKEGSDASPDDVKARIRDKMMNAGYERAHGGMYRKVWLASDHVVKFGVNLGVDENSAEIRNNTRISKKRMTDVVGSGTCNASKYIADVLQYETGDHRWLVMERVEVTPNNVSNDEARRVREALADAGVHINEIEPVNMGRKEGVPVIFDYAGT